MYSILEPIKRPCSSSLIHTIFITSCSELLRSTLNLPFSKGLAPFKVYKINRKSKYNRSSIPYIIHHSFLMISFLLIVHIVTWSHFNLSFFLQIVYLFTWSQFHLSHFNLVSFLLIVHIFFSGYFNLITFSLGHIFTWSHFHLITFSLGLFFTNCLPSHLVTF